MDGVSRFPVKLLLSHSTEKTCKKTLLCFRTSGARKVCLKKSVYLDVLSKLFCLTVKKHFEEESFCVSEIFWCQNFSRTKRCGMEGVSRFPVTIYCLKESKHFVKESFRTSLNSGIEKFSR